MRDGMDRSTNTTANTTTEIMKGSTPSIFKAPCDSEASEPKGKEEPVDLPTIQELLYDIVQELSLHNHIKLMELKMQQLREEIEEQKNIEDEQHFEKNIRHTLYM